MSISRGNVTIPVDNWIEKIDRYNPWPKLTYTVKKFLVSFKYYQVNIDMYGFN